MIRALVVDDEPLVRERVRTLLEMQPDVQVLGECVDGLTALESFRKLTPDVVFLDIKMPVLSGLEVAETWQQEGRLPIIVFVTAYDQFALQAFRLNALDYLMKPVNPKAFIETMARVRDVFAQKDRGDLEQRIKALLESHDRPKRAKPHILVHEDDRYMLIRTADIQCIEATGNYTCLHCERDRHLLRGTLSALEAKLDPEKFMRTHRSWIVNLDHVREAQPWTKGTWLLITYGGMKVPVSIQYRSSLDRIFG
jgi:two-component system LytT family response regulator